MTPKQQTLASVVERLRERVSRDAECGDGFIGNLPVSLLAEAAALIERLSAEREGLAANLSRVTDHLETWVQDHIDEATTETRAAIYCARAALTQGESRQTGGDAFGLSQGSEGWPDRAAPTPADGGGE